MASDPNRDVSPKDAIPLSGWLKPGLLLAIALVLANAVVWAGWRLAPFGWWIIGFVLACGLAMCFRSRPSAHHLLGGLLALACIWLVLADVDHRFLPVNVVSAHPDAWSYDAMAGYIKDYGRSQADQMPLVDQYATHLRDTRFSSASLLALGKIVLGPHHPFAVHEVFYILILLVMFCTMNGLAGAMGLSPFWAMGTGAISLLASWSTNAIVIGNYDNLCFVALLPAALALLLQMAAKPGFLRAGLLGLVVAALFYTYPEGVALSGPALLTLLLVLFWRSSERTRLLGCWVVAALVTVVLCLHYLPVFGQFLAGQFGSRSNGDARPGIGNFTGLLDRRALPAFFALGPEYTDASADPGAYILASLLLCIAVYGLLDLRRRHPWTILAAGVMVLLMCWQTRLARYDYGTYKVLFCHTWLTIPILIAGGRACMERWRFPALLFSMALLIGVGAEKCRHRAQRPWPPASDVASLTELEEVVRITGQAPIFLDLRGDFDHMWATTVLRHAPIVAVQQRGYLAITYVQSALQRARFVRTDDGETFLLSDGPKSGALWSNRRFHLERNPSVFLTGVENPNGAETVEGRPFIWIAHGQESILRVRAMRAGKYTLESIMWWMGPSLPETNQRTFMIVDAEGEHRMVADFKSPRLPVVLAQGDNIIRLRVVEPPSLAVQPNGDHRELMLGMLGYTLKPSDF